jgi:hypothetical protein
MKRFLALLLFLPLGAQGPFTIVSVDRQGSPPFDPATRIYRLDGGRERGLKVGERLAVRRRGTPAPLGHVIITAVRAEQAESSFVPGGVEWPMKGDLVLRQELAPLPVVAPLEALALPATSSPKPSAQAPPMEGLLFFLPLHAELSPAGHHKVETWVESWGKAGRWVIQTPGGKGTKATLQRQRAEVMAALLRELGVARIEVQQEARSHDGPYDPIWLRHWD